MIYFIGLYALLTIVLFYVIIRRPDDNWYITVLFIVAWPILIPAFWLMFKKMDYDEARYERDWWKD